MGKSYAGEGISDRHTSNVTRSFPRLPHAQRMLKADKIHRKTFLANNTTV